MPELASTSFGWAELLLILVGLALTFVPVAIAVRKGRARTAGDRLLWWLFGLFLFLPALIVVLVLPSRRVPGASSSQT